MGILEKHGRRLKEIVVLVAVTMFVTAPVISILHRTLEPAFIARDESSIEGTIGYTIYREEYPQRTSVVVYNGTVNDPGADWYILYESSCRSHDESRGVTLELDGVSIRPDGYIVNSHIGFAGSPTLPLFNYSQVSFSINIRVLLGSANASLRVSYGAWPDPNWCEAGENSTYLDEGQSGTLVCKPPLSGAFNLSSGWIVRTTMLVEIASTEKSLVLIGDVVISADSNENLFPVTFDIQAPDGESLFLNPYMKSLRHAGSNIDEEKGSYPAVELTRTGNSTDSSKFGPRVANETLFLAEGTYEGRTGWFYKHGHSLLDSMINISFSVGPDESILVNIRIPASRLYIDIYPSFAYSRVTVLDGVAYYMIDYPLQDAEYLYLPNRTSIGIHVRPLVYEGHRFIDYAHYNYRQATAAFGIYTAGSSNVRVTVVFSQFSAFGVILDWGQILGILATALLLMLLIHGAAKRSFAGIVTDYNLRTNLLPVSLYFITMFFPWVTYNFDTSEDPFSSVSGAVMVPLFTTLWWTPLSQLTPAPSSYLLPNIIAIVFLYWIPIIYLGYLIATRANSISHELSRKETDPLLSLGVLGGPFIVGCYYMWLCIIGLCYPNLGLMAALSTLPSWGVASWLRRRHNVSHAANVNFRESSPHVPLK